MLDGVKTNITPWQIECLRLLELLCQTMEMNISFHFQ